MRTLGFVALAGLALISIGCASKHAESTATVTSPPLPTGAPASPRPTAVAAADTPEPTPSPALVSLDWLASDVAVPGLSGQPAAPVVDQGLEDAVNGALASFGGQASVVVHNLSDGRYAATNESRVWYAASTFKAAILLTAYQQRDAGTLDFDKLVTLEEKYAVDDLGTLDYLHLKVGDQLSIRDAVKGMIVVSDTPLAVLLQDQVGGNNVDAVLRSIGATTMTVNSHDLPTTALDLAQLMIAIVAGQGVTSESRDEMLSLMAQEWYTDGVVAGLPPGTQYAHKSGSYGPNIHDAAIVWGPAGPYVIVVMTDGSQGWSPIAVVSSAVYQYFAANP
jgi:beta-lactamase class A